MSTYLIHLLKIYNCISDACFLSYKCLLHLYSCIKHTSNDLYNKWIFVPHPLPLHYISATDIKNNVWMYHSSPNILHYTTVQPKTQYKLSWLSAKIVNNEDEYDIDEFLQTFRISTTATSVHSDHVPDVKTIFYCWCIYTKQWFSNTYNIEFHVINRCGEEHVLHLSNSIELYEPNQIR